MGGEEARTQSCSAEEMSRDAGDGGRGHELGLEDCLERRERKVLVAKQLDKGLVTRHSEYVSHLRFRLESMTTIMTG